MYYRVTIRVGRATKTAYLESSSKERVIDLIESLTYYRVTSITKSLYNSSNRDRGENLKTFPIVKVIAINRKYRLCRQFLFHNVIDLKILSNSIKSYLTIDGKKIDCILSVVSKSKES